MIECEKLLLCANDGEFFIPHMLMSCMRSTIYTLDRPRLS